MNAIISKGGKTAHVQLPAEQKQLAGALVYLGENHASDYELKYNEENRAGLKVSLDCHGLVENAIAKSVPNGLRFSILNDALSLMKNLPYRVKRDLEDSIALNGLASFGQLEKMLVDATPRAVTTKYYCPLTLQIHGRDSWGDIDNEGYAEDGEFAARHEDVIRSALQAYTAYDEVNMAEYFHGDNRVKEKIISADWDFERKGDALYGCITVRTAGPLSSEEDESLKEWITGQNSDGLGEGFEQQEIHFDGGYRGGYMYVSFWNPGDDYFVDNETEFEERFNTQGMEMGGM